MTVRPTYSSSSAGATAFSPEMNGDRIAGIWEEIVTVTGFPAGVNTVAPEEARLVTLASSSSAWPAVIPPSAAVYTQVTCISVVPMVASTRGSAPGPMKAAAIQYGS